MNKYYSLVTDIGLAAIANATLTGSLVDIVDFVVGDGGGSYYQPTTNMTKLRGQTWKGKVASVSAVATSPNTFRIRAVLPSSVGGFTIREMGALNGAGQLIAIANTPDMPKVIITEGVTSELEAVIEIVVSNAEVINFTVDPTVIIATKKDIITHAEDGALHVTAAKQAAWDAKANGNHTHTAEQVGARPNTWVPTAEEVGATPAAHGTASNNPHGVTAAQVKARPDTWVPSAAEVKADPEGSAATAKAEAVEAARLDATAKAKVVDDNLRTHANGPTQHVTAAERSAWNDKPGKRHNHSGQTGGVDGSVDGSGGPISYLDLTNRPEKLAPSSHADTHGPTGNDPITPALIGAVSIEEAGAFKGDLSKQDSNLIGLALEVEILKGAALTGVNANIIVESFFDLADVTLMNGVYDKAGKKIYLP